MFTKTIMCSMICNYNTPVKDKVYNRVYKYTVFIYRVLCKRTNSYKAIGLIILYNRVIYLYVYTVFI